MSGNRSTSAAPPVPTASLLEIALHQPYMRCLSTEDAVLLFFSAKNPHTACPLGWGLGP